MRILHRTSLGRLCAIWDTNGGLFFTNKLLEIRPGLVAKINIHNYQYIFPFRVLQQGTVKLDIGIPEAERTVKITLIKPSIKKQNNWNRPGYSTRPGPLARINIDIFGLCAVFSLLPRHVHFFWFMLRPRITFWCNNRNSTNKTQQSTVITFFPFFFSANFIGPGVEAWANPTIGGCITLLWSIHPMSGTSRRP